MMLKANKSTSGDLSDREYYHATEGYKAIQILYEGFRLKGQHSSWGKSSVFGQAAYLTKSLETALTFAQDVVFKCRVMDGVSILRIDGCYDDKIIDSLRANFGKHILSGNVSKAIPHNKHLTRRELIHLVNYRFLKMGSWKASERWKWDHMLSSVRHQLQLHKFDAIGELDNEAGLAVFNPASVEPLGMYHLGYVDEGPFLRALDKQRFLDDLRETIRNLRGYSETTEEYKELDYLELLLDRYRRENCLRE
jgi:hypothetical protein